MRAWFAPLPLPVGEKRDEISLPKISLEDLLAISGSLKEAGIQLRKLPVTEIAQRIDFVARQWSNPDLPERKEALRLLPKFLPFSEPACRRAIDALFEPLAANRMLNLLDELMGDHRALDKFVEYPSGLKRKAFGCDLAFLILSGNIVGIGIWDIVFCLLCKTPVLVKPSSDEPILPTLFAQSLERFVPELASAVAVVPFESERKELVDAAIKECDVVIVYGTDDTVQSVKQKIPPKVKFVERGHKFSIAIVAEEFADERTADLLALDIARFEQRGCLSPQVCFFVGQDAQRRSKDFAQKIATAFKRLDKEMPTNLSEGEKIGVVQFRLACEMMGANVLAPEDASWTVVEWSESSLYGWQKVSCPARILHIVAVESLDKVFELLRPLGKFLQGVAVAMEPEEAEQVAETVGQMGASRVCPVGQLQVPPVEWSQDSKHLISELVRWCDLEPVVLAPKENGWVEFYRGDWEKAASIWQALEQMGIPVKPETKFDPTNPTSPIFIICIPAQHLNEAEQVMSSEHFLSHET
ncbi:MAG: acyl-CoA reductase [Armatimonadota bacterium]